MTYHMLRLNLHNEIGILGKVDVGAERNFLDRHLARNHCSLQRHELVWLLDHILEQKGENKSTFTP